VLDVPGLVRCAAGIMTAIAKRSTNNASSKRGDIADSMPETSITPVL